MWIYFTVAAVFMFVGLFGIDPIKERSSKRDRDYRIALSLLLFISAGFLYGLFLWSATPPKHNSKRYELKTEVRQQSLNGDIVKTDTIYVLTRK